jgi:hypothetical protein
MTLGLILHADPDTPLAQLCRGFDFYDLALELEDRGAKVVWDKLLSMDTCGEVQALACEFSA